MTTRIRPSWSSIENSVVTSYTILPPMIFLFPSPTHSLHDSTCTCNVLFLSFLSSLSLVLLQLVDCCVAICYQIHRLHSMITSENKRRSRCRGWWCQGSRMTKANYIRLWLVVPSLIITIKSAALWCSPPYLQTMMMSSLFTSLISIPPSSFPHESWIRMAMATASSLNRKVRANRSRCTPHGVMSEWRW